MSALANTTTHIDMGAQAAGLARTQTAGTQSLIRVEPRVIKKVEQAALQEATLLGASAFYGWGAGKDRIEGPAWPLTKSLMRIYGNCSLDMEPVQDLPDAWVFTARAVDHETGYSISRQFRQSKRWVVHGRFDDARKDDIRFQIGQSKALRNVALAFLPEWLVDRSMDEAKGGVKAAIEDAVGKHGTDKVLARMLERLKRVGVDEPRLLGAMGVKALAALTIEDLVIIHCGITAVEKGVDSVDEVFPLPKNDNGASKNTSRLEQVLGLGTQVTLPNGTVLDTTDAQTAPKAAEKPDEQAPAPATNQPAAATTATGTAAPAGIFAGEDAKPTTKKAKQA